MCSSVAGAWYRNGGIVIQKKVIIVYTDRIGNDQHRNRYLEWHASSPVEHSTYTNNENAVDGWFDHLYDHCRAIAVLERLVRPCYTFVDIDAKPEHAGILENAPPGTDQQDAKRRDGDQIDDHYRV
jgi:hypothetical protein